MTSSKQKSYQVQAIIESFTRSKTDALSAIIGKGSAADALR